MIRLINTTTRLPVDQALEDAFFDLIKSTYTNAVSEQRYRRLNYIDVQFVSKDDLDLDRKRLRQLELGHNETDREEESNSEQMPDMDLLGVYFPHHSDYHSPVIKVSPEKVMAACQRLKSKTDVKLPLTDLYPTLLHAVVIHELAHSLMDSDSSNDHCDTPWNWLADCLDEEPKVHYLENLDHYFDSHGHCHIHSHSHRDNITPKLEQWRHVIEESLANAFVLKQGFNAEQLAALTLFIANQPPAYKAGLKWKCTLPKLLETAKSWRSFKGHFLNSNWDLIYSETGVKAPLEVLADNLIAAKNFASYNFETEFKLHLIARLPAWQAAFEQGDKKWGEFLNDTGGVLYYLIHFFGHGIMPNQMLKFLMQWASNGSAKAIDELNKTLGEASMEKGNYQEALDYQVVRRTNLPKLNHSDYRHKKHSEEIEKAISELSAMIGVDYTTV